MERNAEGLVLALQSVMAAWMDARDQRRAEQRRRAMKAISFPMAVTAAEESATVCC